MKRNIETTVGIFLLGGIAIICTLIIFFGEVQGLFEPTYEFTVDFPNASGLLKGSDVYLSGASIGKVVTDPEPIPDTQQVEVRLKVNAGVKVRDDAKFVIGSSGLLGDRFVDVQPVQYPEGMPEDQKAKYVHDGQIIKGTQMVGLDELTQSAEPLIERANHIAATLDEMITRLNDDVLSGTSTADLKETIGKLRDMVDNGDSMVKHADEFLVEAKTGNGTLSRLINDPQTADNLAAFVKNLREHGPIFYKDDSTKDAKNR